MTWKWDLTVYDPTTGLYSFQLEDYNDKANSASDPGQEEVLSVPHRYQAESVGTAQIPIGNSGTQYHPNSREFVQSV